MLDQLLLSSLPECAGEGHVVKVCAFEFPLVFFSGEAAELFCDFSCFGASDVSPGIFKCPDCTGVEVLNRASEE